MQEDASKQNRATLSNRHSLENYLVDGENPRLSRHVDRLLAIVTAETALTWLCVVAYNLSRGIR
jgi:hypothetical protein